MVNRNIERRKDERYNVALDIEWSAERKLTLGRLNDVSSAGCFVLTGGNYAVGEIVCIHFPMSDGTKSEFYGEIINCEPEIGFGLRFVNLGEPQRQFLRHFAELHHSDLNQPIG